MSNIEQCKFGVVSKMELFFEFFNKLVEVIAIVSQNK